MKRSTEQAVRQYIEEGTKEIAQAVAKEAKRTAPVDTGTYRDSIHVEKARDGGWEVVSDAVSPEGFHYSGIVEFKHTLTARGGNLARAVLTVKKKLGGTAR